MQATERDMDRRRQDGVERHGARALLDRIRGEYREMPGLCLSRPQAERLWGLSAERCAGVLEALIGDGDLMRTRDGRYMATPRLLMRRRHLFADRGRGAA